MIRNLVLALALLSCLLPLPSSAGYEQGLEAYERGDYATALEQWRPLAEAGHARAQHRLAGLYEQGKGVARDYRIAIGWLRKAAKQGLADAQLDLYRFYDQGLGTPQHRERALYWLRRAAEQGVISAQYNLALAYQNGDGIKRSRKRAAYWYERAANQGDVDAQFNLGLMYASGKIIGRDLVKAHVWFNLAAGQGDEDARENRDIVAAAMSPEEIRMAQDLALQWKPVKEQGDRLHASASRERITTAQEHLKALGYLDGPADGLLNADTLRAVRRFQKDMNVEATGKIDAELIALLELARALRNL